MRRIPIPAGQAVSVELGRGRSCRVVNTEGGQVVDTWAFSAPGIEEYLSMAHSRTATYRLVFRPGDVLVSNAFQPMVTVVDDASPGVHDSLHAACSAGSFEFFGGAADHPNCQDNLKRCMSERGHSLRYTPDPWNLFESSRVGPDLDLIDGPSPAAAGDYVELRAERDLILVCSACPSGVGGISGGAIRGAAIDLMD